MNNTNNLITDFCRTMSVKDKRNFKHITKISSMEDISNTLYESCGKIKMRRATLRCFWELISKFYSLEETEIFYEKNYRYFDFSLREILGLHCYRIIEKTSPLKDLQEFAEKCSNRFFRVMIDAIYSLPSSDGKLDFLCAVQHRI